MPLFPEENGEVVLRGIQVLWFAIMNQWLVLAAVSFCYWLDNRRKRKNTITLTTSTGQMDGEYIKVSGRVPPKPENFSPPAPVIPPRGR